MRPLAAIAIAPIAVIPILVIVFGPWAFSNGGMRSLVGIVGPALILAYALVVLFGVPMHLALVRARCTRIRDYAIAGALLGSVPIIGYVIVAVAFEAKFVPPAMSAALLRNLEWGAIGVLVFGLCGTAIAIAFRATALASPSQSR